MWLRFLTELQLDTTHSSTASLTRTHCTTRARVSCKKTFLTRLLATRQSLHSSHQQLLLAVKHTFDHTTRDCKRVLQRLIDKHFPPTHSLTRSFDVNTRSELLEGYSLLNLAARYGRYSCIHYLTHSLHADPNTADNGGFTPYLNACYRGDLAIVKLLHHSGARTDALGCLR